MLSVPDYSISLKIPRAPMQHLGQLSHRFDMLQAGLRAPPSLLQSTGDLRSTVIQRADSRNSTANPLTESMNAAAAAVLQNPFSMYAPTNGAYRLPTSLLDVSHFANRNHHHPNAFPATTHGGPMANIYPNIFPLPTHNNPLMANALFQSDPMLLSQLIAAAAPRQRLTVPVVGCSSPQQPMRPLLAKGSLTLPLVRSTDTLTPPDSVRTLDEQPKTMTNSDEQKILGKRSSSLSNDPSDGSANSDRQPQKKARLLSNSGSTPSPARRTNSTKADSETQTDPDEEFPTQSSLWGP